MPDAAASHQLADELDGVLARGGPTLPGKPELWPRAATRPVREAEDMVAFGPYRLSRPVGAICLAGERVERHFAVHDRDHTSHLVYRWPARRDAGSQHRLLDALGVLAGASSPALLPVETFAITPSGCACLVTPYTGNQDGMFTLEAHLRIKGGRLAPYEARRGAEQLLHAMAGAHAAGLSHGPLSPSGVLIDRHGRLWIELCALGRVLDGQRLSDASRAADIAGVASLAYRMLTGVEPRKSRAGRLLAATVLAPRVAPAWDAWFARAFGGQSDAATLAGELSGVA